MLNFADELGSFDDRYTVLHADTIEDVSEWMEHNFGPWRPGIGGINAERKIARFSHKDVAGIGLATYRWEASIDTHCDAGQDVLFIAFPMKGHARMHIEGVGDVDPGPARARVCRRGVAHSTFIPAGYESLSLVVPMDLLRRRARSFYGPLSDKPLDFSPLLDLDRPQGATVLGLARHLVQSLIVDPRAYDNPLVQATLRDMVSGVLLANLRHNGAESASKRAAFPLPRTVRQAEDFMRANAHRPICVEDLAQAAGCSERALHEAFRRFRDMTPMQALRDIRLDGARHDLERDAGPVIDISIKWGFSNPGRFAQAYADKFGEKPSETRRGGAIRSPGGPTASASPATARLAKIEKSGR